jgi:acetoacetyl-CoA synthetase
VAQRAAVWTPTPDVVARANVTRFIEWLEASRNLRFDGYDPLRRWSVDHLEEFWEAVWDFYGLGDPRPGRCCPRTRCRAPRGSRGRG